MTLAREVRLTTVDGSVRLVQQPVLAGPPAENTDTFELCDSAVPLPDAIPGSAQVIEAEILPRRAGRVNFTLLGSSDGNEGTILSYDTRSATLTLDRRHSGNTGFHAKFASAESAPLVLEDGLLKLLIVVDRCSVEVFAQGGKVVLSDLVFPSAGSRENRLSAEGGPATILKLAVSPLA
jgi:levanase/levanbiose-producing levanase